MNFKINDFPPKYQKQILEQLNKRGHKNILLPEKKPNKYRAQKVTIDGHVFDSIKEAQFYQDLKLRLQAGEIVAFELQPTFILQEGFVNKDGKKRRPITYTADFKIVYPNGEIEIVDVKGYKTKVFMLKRKLFEYKYPEYSLKVVE